MSAHLVLDALLLVLFLRRLHLAHTVSPARCTSSSRESSSFWASVWNASAFCSSWRLFTSARSVSLGRRLELVLARLLDAARLNLVVADLAVELDVGVRLDLALDLLLLARLELAAVALLGGLYQRRRSRSA